MKYIWILIISFLVIDLYSQTTFRNKVIVKVDVKNINKAIVPEKPSQNIKNYTVYRIVKINKQDTFKVDANSVVTEKKEVEYNDINHQMKKKTTYSKNENLIYQKKVSSAEKFYSTKKRNRANLFISKDTIYVNFWITKNYYSLDSTGQANATWKPNEKYFIKLQNRQSVSFSFNSIEVSTLLIPFKYQYGYTKNGTDIESEIKTDLNLNAFLGVRTGRVNYFYDKYTSMVETKWSYTFGAFIGLNALKLDSTSTSLSPTPLTKERNVPSFSYGLGIVFNIRDFNLGAFLGADAGLNKEARQSNFQNKPWLGFGLGYKLGFLAGDAKN